MLEKWPARMPRWGGGDRNVYVWVPEAAKKHPRERYPVLYMFDGHNVFLDSDATYGKSWGMLEYLRDNRVPLIVCAVDCDHRPDNARLKEYSPFTVKDTPLGPIQGMGHRYMAWLIHELKPVIDEKYPTLPDRNHTWIAGSSMGGLMSLYAVLKFNDVFSKAACLSPSLWLTGERLKKLVNESPAAADTVIYMDYGAREMQNHEGMRAKFLYATQRLLEKQILLTSRIVPNGDHCEACWEEQLPIFMRVLLYERE